ncbi:LPXTG cell wall anchor domain-containing protein [Vagococcus xieshaowenii]|uniref:LPXTG cell wall anchor domain-containing protein n=1 Tax=Vagococcus xieshaowenii TaxID=2562451 RepID=A0AAJ5EGB5_9ENTE|nr:LPXTG cell wall anchor domain-containing protein [Vagococcus xieshaowenii]QCA29415.1 LPXTG cell wall anchor domain-containing protein [Vagococcus xieshaowenii]TFZ41536.1 LPXTG cell wall anchor domain-containing protein [Vagococcus xieshaowenii]
MKKYLLMSALLCLFPMSTLSEESSEVLDARVTTTDSPTIEQTSDYILESSAIATSQSTQEPTSIASSEDVIESRPVESAKIVTEQEAVLSQIEQELGVEAATRETAIDQENDPESIRATLSSVSDLISKEEIDGYTDEQLLNAMKVTERVGADIYGLDVGGYIRILQALYKDHTLSWEVIEPMLAYDPNSYDNALKMIPEVDQLVEYLAALYPSDSSFIAIPKLSAQEVTNILSYFSPIQKEMLAESGALFPGIIGWIWHYSSNEEVLTTEASTIESSMTPPTETTIATSEVITDSSEQQKVEAVTSSESTDENKGIMPQTGEQKKTWLTVLGLVLVFLVVSIIIRRNKVNKR